jgi:hypothetical protein
MPATPNSLRRPKLKTISLDFGEGDCVSFTFDRNKITDAWMEDWDRLEQERDIALMNEALADLIIAWDIVNEDGSPYESSAEHIGFLFNIADKALILREMITATAPTEAEKRGSSKLSSTPSSDSTEQAPNSPNGSETSPLPAPSASPSPT